jgi:hypothetical protein
MLPLGHAKGTTSAGRPRSALPTNCRRLAVGDDVIELDEQRLSGPALDGLPLAE